MDVFVAGFSRRVTGSCASQSTLGQDGAFAARARRRCRGGHGRGRSATRDRGRASRACRAWQRRPRGGRDAQPSIDKVVDQGVRLCRMPPERVMTAAFDRDELRAAHLGVRGLARPWGWIWSLSPWMNSTGQRILRYISSLTSNPGRMPRAATVLSSVGPLVSVAQPIPSSICLVECGSLQRLRMKNSAKSG